MYRQAIKGDVERTIITPSPNDKFNMMYGVIRVDNLDLARGLDNEFGKALGFYKTQFGGKFQNAYGSSISILLMGNFSYALDYVRIIR